MISVQTGLAFRSQYLENDIKTHGFGDITTNLKTCRGLGLKIMNSVYFKRNYKTNLSKTLPQTGFETAPRLENHEDRTFEYISSKKSIKNQAQTRFETAPVLENDEIRIFAKRIT